MSDGIELTMITTRTYQTWAEIIDDLERGGLPLSELAKAELIRSHEVVIAETMRDGTKVITKARGVWVTGP